MSNLRMPQSLDEVTADWLTQALSHRFPGTVVTSAVPGSEVRATGTKLRLLLVRHAYRENDEVIRIISARKATPNERKQYGSYL